MRKLIAFLTSLSLLLGGTASAQTPSIPLGPGSGSSSTLSFPTQIAGTVTSGGIPFFNMTTQISSSALLAANSLMVGGGAGTGPSTTATDPSVLTAVANPVNGSGGLLTNAISSLPSLTTVGTIGTGVWQGTGVGFLYGGTGLTALGSANACLTTNSSATAMAWAACTSAVTLTVGTTATSGGGAGRLMFDSGTTLTESSGLLFNVSTTGSATTAGLTVAPTWNSTGVIDAALLVNPTNTASGAASLLADFQLGGVSQASVDKAGNVKAAAGFYGPLGSLSATAFGDSGSVNTGMYFPSATNIAFSIGGLAKANLATFTFEVFSGVSIGFNSGTLDTQMSRLSAGVTQFGTTAANNLGSIEAASFISGGSHPTGTTGTCTASGFTGGSAAGTFSAAVCSGGIFILSGLPTAPNGYVCIAQDQTTSTDTLKQTASSSTSCTLTSTTAASDVVAFQAIAF